MVAETSAIVRGFRFLVESNQNMENWQATNIQLLILTTRITRTTCEIFMITHGICDFLTQKWQFYCTVLVYFRYILFQVPWQN